MRKNTEQTQVRNNTTLGRPSRIKRLTGVLGSILILAALHNSNLALGAVLPSTESVTLAWNNSSTPGVAGYRVHYGQASGNYTSSVEAGNSTTNTLPGLVSGVTYFFAVTAYDANGLESVFSDEVSFAPGQASLQIRVTANGQAVLTVKGPVGKTYDIQATPNLTTWSVIGSVTMGAGGSMDFTDTSAANFPKRFYRAHNTLP